MKSFRQYLEDYESIDDSNRSFIYRVLARMSHFDPKDVEDTKDMLLKLQSMVDDKLTGT